MFCVGLPTAVEGNRRLWWNEEIGCDDLGVALGSSTTLRGDLHNVSAVEYLIQNNL